MKSSAPESGLCSSLVKPLGNRDYRMLEILDDDELDIRGRKLGLDVDGNAVIGGVVDDAHLVVRALAGAEPDLDRLSLQYAIST